MNWNLRGWVLAICLSVLPVRAHVGSPFVVFEGRAGTIPIRVVVRQPEVVPGLAEISVRLLAGAPKEIRVRPLHWRTDRTGAPRPDVARLVTGETRLYTAALWLMSRGAYGIEIQVEGPEGGTALVPVNSIAYDRKPMPKTLGFLLSFLGIGLIAGAFSIAVAAAREATLPSGQAPGRSQRFRAVLAGLISVIALSGLLYGSWVWWNREDRFHNTRVLYRQTTHTVTTQARDAETVLQLHLTDPRQKDPGNRLIPDHGKLVHLFLIEQGASNLIPALAHLHPRSKGENRFTSALPELPAGNYRVFTELAHEGGFTQTLTNSIQLPAFTGPPRASDPDDAWASPNSVATSAVSLGEGFSLQLEASRRRAGEVSLLRARVTRADGSRARLQSYLRMLGHAVILRDDGSVFAHLHPAGNLSMAATRSFALKLDGDAGALAADANCGDLESVPPDVAAALGQTGEVSFPYVFPQPGRYFVWVQVKVDGRIRTAPLAIEVESSP